MILDPLLKTFLTTGLLIVISTETLGWLGLIDLTGLLSFWLICSAAILFAISGDFFRNKLPIKVNPPQAYNRQDFILLTGIFLYCLTLGITALVTPPNTWDSLTTHMARVAHWIQNHTVSNYPSWVLKQLNYPPAGAYILLHLQTLTGSDSLANMAQWIAMTGVLIAAVLISRELGLDRRGQIISAVVALTVPMGLLQAVSTQNEQINSLWIMSFVLFSLKSMRTMDLQNSLWAGISIALATGVKGTGIIFGLPFFLWTSALLMRKNMLKGLGHATIVIFILGAINTPFLLRGLQLTQTLIAPSETENMLIKHPSASSILVNTLRNLAGHFTLPLESWNTIIRRSVGNFDKMSPGQPKFDLPGHAFHEDVAGNFLHTLLIFLSALVSVWNLFLRRSAGYPHGYGLSLLAGFLLFTIFVRWTPFNVRYHLPLFLLAAPWITRTLSVAGSRVLLSVAFFLLVASAPWLFLNRSRPWFGPKSIFLQSREAQYFSNNPDFRFSYDRAVEKLDELACPNIGLSFKGESWEYPLWPLLRKKFKDRLRLEHVACDNASCSLAYPRGVFSPCAIVTDSPDQRETISVNNRTFLKKHVLPILSIYAPAESFSATAKSIRHFRRAIRPIPNTNITSLGNLQILITEIQERIQDARLVNPAILGKIDPVTTTIFFDRYLKGLTLLMDGLRTQNSEALAQGSFLIKEWSDWSAGNFNRVGGILLAD